jgi:hypothetical protein
MDPNRKFVHHREVLNLIFVERPELVNPNMKKPDSDDDSEASRRVWARGFAKAVGRAATRFDEVAIKLLGEPPDKTRE